MITKKILELDDAKLLLEVLDARTVRLTIYALDVKIFGSSDKDIDRIVINGKEFININNGSKVLTFSIVDGFESEYVITKIVHKPGLPVFNLLTYRKTTCSYFMPAFIADNRDDLEWSRYFVNSYVVGFGSDQYALGILVRFFPIESFYELERRLKANKAYRNSYKNTNQHLLFVFAVKPDDIDDLDILLSSKYSKLSDSIKKRILKFHGYSKDGMLGKVLYKHDSLRKQLQLNLNVKYIGTELELFNAIDLEKETIIIKEEKELVN